MKRKMTSELMVKSQIETQTPFTKLKVHDCIP